MFPLKTVIFWHADQIFIIKQVLLGKTVTRTASLHDYRYIWRCTRQETKTIEKIDASLERDVKIRDDSADSQRKRRK